MQMLLSLFQRLLNIVRRSQLEQAIGQLNDGQRPQLTIHAFNCYARIVQRLREYISSQTVLNPNSQWS